MKKLLIISLSLLLCISCVKKAPEIDSLFSEEEQRALNEQQQEFLQKKEAKKLQKEKEKNLDTRSQLEKDLLSDDLLNKVSENNTSATKTINESKAPEVEILELDYDISHDQSITKYVNNTTSFTNKKYIPKNLVWVKWNFITTSKNMTLTKEALESLNSLAEAFNSEFNKKISVISAYRSYEYQKKIKTWGCLDIFCAKPGYSEHQSGLAIDLWEATTKEEFLSKSELSSYFTWLENNAYRFWYINTYQKWIEIDGYEEEPWHWRYVGVKFATFLRQNDFTFWEYASLKLQ